MLPLTTMRRYSKPRGAGDQTSGGRGKLLRAQGELTRLQILVRETLQNSWDAGDDEWYPAYGVHVRHTTGVLRRLLRDQVFTELGPELADLQESIRAEDLHVVEVFDRGTSGLNGPVNAEEAVAEGEPNNFNAFVFDIGSTKPLGQSGGTFGFGKTATFEVSQPHAVVYWTRCDRGDGVLEDRLIASALHDPYAIGGKRFTGAHWWGDASGEMVLPLRGEPARQLAEALFETHFGEDETGTSILVIDPMVTLPEERGTGRRVAVRTEAQGEELGRQMLEALITSAWSKLVPYASGDTPMIVKFDVYGREVDVAALVEERFDVYGHGLACIRAAQLGEHAGTSWKKPELIVEETLEEIVLRPVLADGHTREEYFKDRPDNVAGHLYLGKVVRDPSKDGTEWKRVNQACFMRSDAELVVWYESLADDDASLFQWYAVFKPTPECDFHFAAAEPSTHDAWNKSAPEDPASTYVVEKTLAHVRRKAREFLGGKETAPVAEARSARQLSKALSGFIPTVEIDEPSSGGKHTPGGGGGGGSTKRSHRIDVVSSSVDEQGRCTVHFEFHGDNDESRTVEARVSAQTSEGMFALEDDEATFSWSVGDWTTEGRAVELKNGSTGSLRIEPAMVATLALDFDVRGDS